MSARSDILAAVRSNRPAIGNRSLAPFTRSIVADGPLVERFAEGLGRMGGELLDGGIGPTAMLANLAAGHGLTCSTVPEFAGDVSAHACAEPAAFASVDLAIVRAALGVAETGSVLLTERELVANALGYLAQHLIVLLDPADLVPTLHEAYTHPAFTAGAYACLHSGPSATADIEGVLIRGAQGVRSLRVLFAPRLPEGRSALCEEIR